MYSGNQVKKAGKVIRNAGNSNHLTENLIAALDVMDWWRDSHTHALAEAFEVIVNLSASLEPNSYCSKRLKRYESLRKKLLRMPQASLSSLDDIGGCRAVIPNLYQVKNMVEKLENSLGDFNKNDYLDPPKFDGYRGVHIKTRFGDGDCCRKIEIQIRTELQHLWATALESVDFCTQQDLKNGYGEEKWKAFFKLLSEHFWFMECYEGIISESIQSPPESTPLSSDNNKLNVTKNSGESPYKAFYRYESAIRENEDERRRVEFIKNYSKSLRVISIFKEFQSHFNSETLESLSESDYFLVRLDLNSKQVEILDENSNERFIEQEKLYLNSQRYKTALFSANEKENLLEAYPSFFASNDKFLSILETICDLNLHDIPLSPIEIVSSENNVCLFWGVIFDGLNYEVIEKKI